MNRFVGRSTIVAVALATTLGAGAALADTSGISPESLKSALTSTRTANSSFANAVKLSTFGNAERFARYQVATQDQSEFAALKSSVPAGARVGILAPEHNGDVQFAQAGILTPQHNGDTQLAAALAERPLNAAFGDTQGECESAPVKLADVGAAMRSLSGEPSIAGDGSSLAQALQLSGSSEAMANYKRFAANGDLQGSPSFAAIDKGIVQDGTSNTQFAALQVNDVARIKAALSGSSDASSALSDNISASELASALQKR